MTGNPFDNPTVDMMYRDALQSLYAGAVMPWDREILAIAPLPADVVDPFASQDVDPLQIMSFAYNSLAAWIDEARKANYFSKRFTDLSKLVLKGVMTMGRGLVTLHNRGEDLSRAPMQIGDLISVGSYHFRKSYLGVVQTAKSHPEISERLLVNQLSWTNMLLRLYKTKEKLAKPVSGVRDQVSKLNSECGMRNSELPSDADSKTLPNEDILTSDHLSPATDNSSLLPLNSSLDQDEDVHAFSDVDALFAPAALSAPRALSPMRNSECGRQNEKTESGARANSEFGMRNSELPSDADRKNLSNEENLTTDHRSPATDNHLPAADSSSFLLHNSSSDDNSSPDEVPPYVQILHRALERGKQDEEGSMTFTFDEIRYLASDENFARRFPVMAADIRKMRKQIDSS